MRAHFAIAAAAALCVLGTVACSTTPTGTAGYPSPAALTAGATAVEAGYAVACGFSKSCTPADNKAEADAAKAINDFIAGTYTEAYNTGSVTQALVDNEAALLADVSKIIADIKGGRHRSG